MKFPKTKPRKPKTYAAKRYTPKPIQPQTLPISSNHSSSVSEEEQGRNQTQNEQELNSRLIKIIIEKDNRKEVRKYWPNIIGWITAATSAFAVLVALDANKKTQQALAHQIEKDSLDDIADSIKHKEDSLKYRKQFALDSTSTQAQIDALNLNAKDFSIRSVTTVFTDDFSATLSSSEDTLTITYAIKIQGLQSITFYSAGFGYDVIKSIPTKQRVNEVLDKTPDTTFGFVASQIGQRTKYRIVKADLGDKEAIRKGQSLIFFAGQLNYDDPVTLQPKHFRFAVAIEGFGGTLYKKIL